MVDKKEPHVQIERRKGTDFWVKTLQLLTLIAWLVLLISLITFEFARPESIPGYAKYKSLEAQYRTEWRNDLSNLLFIELLTCTFLSAVAILINRQRMRRITDRMHFNTILLFVVSITACLYIWIDVLS